MENKYLEDRRAHLAKIMEMGNSPWPARFAYTHTPTKIHSEYDSRDKEALEKEPPKVRVPGRLINLRVMGKAGFADLSDGHQKIQIYVRKNDVGDDQWELYKNLDLGDIVGAEGEVFRTRTDELTVKIQTLTFLAKAFAPPPEKWHGLQDIEKRYRQRYLDLISNPESRRVFERRALLLKHLRDWMDDHDYFEVETPMMHPIPGGAVAEPFVTHHEALDIDLYLRIAPELYLKRLVIGGFFKVYEINRNFRNEGLSQKHNPEFTTIESYAAFADYNDIMDMCEESITYVLGKVLGEEPSRTTWGNTEIDWPRPWRRVRYDRIILEHHPDLKPEDLQNETRLSEYVKSKNIEVEHAADRWDLLSEIFDHTIEPKLINPTMVTHLPKAHSPLAKACPEDPDWAERFELFIGGMELANAFSELNDPFEQRQRFEAQVTDAERRTVDEDYLDAMMYGLPPTGGYGLGIDRLTMIFSNVPSIRDVILFPQMRPKPATL